MNPITSAFAANLADRNFPRERALALPYVNEHYLVHLQANELEKFAEILIRRYFRQDVPDWRSYNGSVLHALNAIQKYYPELWRNKICPLALMIISEDWHFNISNTFIIMREFGNVIKFLDQGTVDILLSFINLDDFYDEGLDGIFACAHMDLFSDRILSVFSQLDIEAQARIVSRFPHIVFLWDGLQHLRSAGSHECAEVAFRGGVAPLAPVVRHERSVELVVEAVEANSYVWTAPNMPVLLAAFLDLVPECVVLDPRPWVTFRRRLQLCMHDSRYSDVWLILAKRGLSI